MAGAAITDNGPVHHNNLAGLVDFAGDVVTSAGALDGAFGTDEIIACMGTDQSMVDVIVQLVADGRQVKVFEDRPRLVLPHGGSTRLRRATVLVIVAGAIRSRLQSSRRRPMPAALRRRIRRLPSSLERRAGNRHRRTLNDPWLRRQLAPRKLDHRVPVHSDDYYRALEAPNCRVITWPVARITDSGVRTCDGLEHRVDRIVVAH